MSIGIIGNGVVGSATAKVWENQTLAIHDSDESRSRNSFDEAASADFCFLCLPTPGGDGGGLNTTALDGTIKRLMEKRREETIYVIRSTVPIGYTARWGGIKLLHSPEFLTARQAEYDALNPQRMIIGTPQRDSAAAGELAKLYWSRFPTVPVMIMGSNDSELCKLACNSFYAVKVWFFNEIRRMAGHEWAEVREGMISGGMIALEHTKVPGPDGLLGFGGACLPKDFSELAGMSQGPPGNIFRMILARNEQIRKWLA